MRKLSCGCRLWEPEDQSSITARRTKDWRPWAFYSWCDHHRALVAGEKEPVTKYDKAFASAYHMLELHRKQVRTTEKLACALLIEQDKKGDTP